MVHPEAVPGTKKMFMKPVVSDPRIPLHLDGPDQRQLMYTPDAFAGSGGGGGYGSPPGFGAVEYYHHRGQEFPPAPAPREVEFPSNPFSEGPGQELILDTNAFGGTQSAAPTPAASHAHTASAPLSSSRKVSIAESSLDVKKRVSGLLDGLFDADQEGDEKLTQQTDEDEKGAVSANLEGGGGGEQPGSSQADSTPPVGVAATEPPPQPDAPSNAYARPRTQAHSHQVPFPANAHYQTMANGALQSPSKLTLPSKLPHKFGGGGRPGTTGGGGRSSASSVSSRAQNVSSGEYGINSTIQPCITRLTITITYHTPYPRPVPHTRPARWQPQSRRDTGARAASARQ